MDSGGNGAHVRICNGTEELWVFLAKLLGADRVQGDLVGRWGIGLEDAVGLPFRLNLLLPGDQGVSLLGLHRVGKYRDQSISVLETYTLELLRLRDGDDDVWSRHDGWLLLFTALVTGYLKEDTVRKTCICSLLPKLTHHPTSVAVFGGLNCEAEGVLEVQS